MKDILWSVSICLSFRKTNNDLDYAVITKAISFSIRSPSISILNVSVRLSILPVLAQSGYEELDAPTILTESLIFSQKRCRLPLVGCYAARLDFGSYAVVSFIFQLAVAFYSWLNESKAMLS